MEIKGRLHQLHTHTILRVVLPLSLFLALIAVIWIVAYERVITLLIVQHHSELASVAAGSVSQTLEDYADILSVLGSDSHLLEQEAGAEAALMEGISASLHVFNAGILIADESGTVLATSTPPLDILGDSVRTLDVFQQAHSQGEAAFSDVITGQDGSSHMVLVSAPVMDTNQGVVGVVLGGLELESAAIGEPVRRISIGEHGYAYLVDRQGHIIYHPDTESIGSDYTQRPYIQKEISSGTYSQNWQSPTGERLVVAAAMVAPSGWRLVVEEPVRSIRALARPYELLAAALSLLAIAVLFLLSWTETAKVVRPIQLLSEQARRIAVEQGLKPLDVTGIEEIDTLEQAFDHMAVQVAAYREGLRRYAEAITQSQEEERQRIARDLHDETSQSLLAISRQIELLQAQQDGHELRQRLEELLALTRDTLSNVRQISQDLRPLMLEDLGLIPALQALLRNSDPEMQVHLEVSGEADTLSADQELALFRITQEALNNVRKHAQASEIRVRLKFDREIIRLEIQDNGRGFQLPEAITDLARSGHFGLMGIQERAWAAGGVLSIQTAPGEGTHISVSLPRAA